MKSKMLIACVMTAGLAVGCGPSTEEYSRYAQAGVKYTGALHTLLATAGDIGVDATSEQLLVDERLLKAPEVPATSILPSAALPITLISQKLARAAEPVALSCTTASPKITASKALVALAPLTMISITDEEAASSVPVRAAPPEAVCRNSAAGRASEVSSFLEQACPSGDPVRCRLYRSYANYTRCDNERLLILGQLRKQTQLLGKYFGKLDELATSDSPDRAAESAATIGKELGGVVENLSGTSVKSKLLDGSTLSGVFGSIAKGILRAEIRGALGRELNERRETLQKALHLQKELLAALASQTQADVEFVRLTREQRKVIEPYVGTKSVERGDDWLADRRGVLTMNATVVQLVSAQSAAGEMEQSFNDLVDGKLTPGRATALLGEINNFLDVANTLKKNLKESS